MAKRIGSRVVMHRALGEVPGTGSKRISYIKEYFSTEQILYPSNLG